MMSPVEIALRLIAGLTLFFFLVWDWSWRLYVTGEISDAIAAAAATITTDDDRQVIRDHFEVLSLFIGNHMPSRGALNLFLMARGLFGISLMVAALWRVGESLVVTSEKRYTLDMFIVVFGASVFFFICGLLLHGYNIGFFTTGGNLS